MMLKIALTTLGLLGLAAIVTSTPASAGRISLGTPAPAISSQGLVQPCKYCIYKTPAPGDTVQLNPQPLPPKESVKQGSLLRR
jgi:hypothetical protein